MNNVTYPPTAKASLDLRRKRSIPSGHLGGPARAAADEECHCPLCDGQSIVEDDRGLCPLCGSTEPICPLCGSPELLCPLCGSPEPCRERTCIDALFAQADYAEGGRP